MDKAHIQTDKQLEEMERRLGEIYRRASAEIKEKWAAYLKEVEPEISAAQKAYAAAKRTGNAEEIRKAGRELSKIEKEKILMDRHYKNLVEQTAEELAHVNESALAYINGELPKTYVRNFESVCDGIESAVSGYSFELVDKNTAKRLITEGDKTLLPKPSQKTLAKIEKSLKEGKDIRWNTRKINAEVLQGILQGDSMDKIAARMRRVTDMNATSAIRNARTMVTGAENAGRMDMLRQAGKDGIQVKKKWLATKDKRTRHWHLDLDGVLKDEDEPFTNEHGDIMYPGDPNADPANVYQCRCSLGYKVVGFR